MLSLASREDGDDNHVRRDIGFSDFVHRLKTQYLCVIHHRQNPMITILLVTNSVVSRDAWEGALS
jgi:hypothetical protein